MIPGKLYKLVPRKMSVYGVPAQGANEWEILHIPFGSIGMFVGDSAVYEKFLVGERLILLTASERNLYFKWIPLKEEEEELNEDVDDPR